MTLRARAIGRIGGYALGLFGGIGMLVITAGRVGIGREPVSVMVLEPDVRVVVGSKVFDVAGITDEPLLCDLPPGEYRLTMTRRGDILCDFRFDVTAGYGAAVTARRESEGHFR